MYPKKLETNTTLPRTRCLTICLSAECAVHADTQYVPSRFCLSADRIHVSCTHSLEGFRLGIDPELGLAVPCAEVDVVRRVSAPSCHSLPQRSVGRIRVRQVRRDELDLLVWSRKGLSRALARSPSEVASRLTRQYASASSRRLRSRATLVTCAPRLTISAASTRPSPVEAPVMYTR